MTKSVSAPEASRWLAAGEAVLIDVREPDEVAAGRIPNAVAIPLSALPQVLPSLKLAPGTKLVFQCTGGMRGERACAVATSLSGLAAYNLEGGMAAWRAASLPIQGEAGPRFTIFRQVQMVVGGLVACLVLAGFAGFTAAFAVAGVLGAALAFAGFTGWCGLALLLSHMPWNRPAPTMP